MRRLFFIIKNHVLVGVSSSFSLTGADDNASTFVENEKSSPRVSLARGCSTRLNDYTKNIFWWFPRCVSLTTPPLSYYRQITFNSDAFFFLVHVFLWQKWLWVPLSKLIASLNYSCSILWMSYVSVRVDRESAIFAVATIDGLAEVARL